MSDDGSNRLRAVVDVAVNSVMAAMTDTFVTVVISIDPGTDGQESHRGGKTQRSDGEISFHRPSPRGDLLFQISDLSKKCI
jgi:hypothetical protein